MVDVVYLLVKLLSIEDGGHQIKSPHPPGENPPHPGWRHGTFSHFEMENNIESLPKRHICVTKLARTLHFAGYIFASCLPGSGLGEQHRLVAAFLLQGRTALLRD